MFIVTHITFHRPWTIVLLRRVDSSLVSCVSTQWRAGPCVAGEANSKFGALLFVTVANLLETSISNYLLYSILLSIFDFQD